MKLAVLADIHANYEALQTLTDHIEGWGADQVIVLGDIINRGPRPVECLDFVVEKIQTRNWHIIRGNHEDYVISHEMNNYTDLEKEFHLASYWTYLKLADKIHHLQAFEDIYTSQSPDGGEIRAVHASMKNNRDGIYPEMSNHELSKKITPAPKLFLTGHTHRPMIRKLEYSLVVNAGSVGLPFDKDQRATYAQLTWNHRGWQPEIVRVKYEIEKARKDFFDTGFISEGGPLARIMLQELIGARSLLYTWVVNYKDVVLEGLIPIDQTVKEFLNMESRLHVQTP